MSAKLKSLDRMIRSAASGWRCWKNNLKSALACARFKEPNTRPLSSALNGHSGCISEATETR
jgi:hypothetical protein